MKYFVLIFSFSFLLSPFFFLLSSFDPRSDNMALTKVAKLDTVIINLDNSIHFYSRECYCSKTYGHKNEIQS